MALLTVPIRQVCMSVKAPRVVRYINSEFALRFFEDGTLRLRSFASFRKEEHAERKDSWEGWMSFQSSTKNGNFAGIVGMAGNALMMCTSLVRSEGIREKFECSSWYEIKDPFAFASVIANSMSDCIGVLHGPCFYSDRCFVDPIDYEFEPPDNEDGMLRQVESMEYAMRRATAGDEFFCKPLSYQEQHEYRFVWLLAEEAPPERFVSVKAASKFCNQKAEPSNLPDVTAQPA